MAETGLAACAAYWLAVTAKMDGKKDGERITRRFAQDMI
jgi:hypothetical protein